MSNASKEAYHPSVNKLTNLTETITLSLGNGVSIDLVKIPSGSFQMGAPASEESSRDNERPQHMVTVPEFWMGKYAVTQAQYQTVTTINPSHFSGDDHPVECVSWHEAIAFCQKIAQETGIILRLPSEAEWEYACRAGTTTPVHFGETIRTDQANYDGSNVYGNGREGPYREKTTPVGSFPANDFGLYDMHGNVLEWCQDCWHDSSYAHAPQDGSPWVKDTVSLYKVMRGGSWDYDPRYCRSASRFSYSPDDYRYTFGFRVCCSAPQIFR